MTTSAKQAKLAQLGQVPRVMPVQKPGKSEQTVETPWELIDAIEGHYGPMTFDLAATRENCKVRTKPRGLLYKPTDMRYGPGSRFGHDALKEDWNDLVAGNFWLNPPYGSIAPWAERCSLQKKGKIFFLIPASVGSNWWASFVDTVAEVRFLSPRLTFVGHTASYPKDIALCVYGSQPDYTCWRWKK